jgi:hypothetical protein
VDEEDIIFRITHYHVSRHNKEEWMKVLNARYVLPLFIFGIATACGSAPPSVFETPKLVCASDGLCISYDQDKYFYGAFRSGNQELQFKVHRDHWSPTALLVGGDKTLVSCLMTDEQIDLLSGSLVCSENAISGAYKSPQEYKDVGALFLSHLEETTPDAHLEAEWRTLTEMLRNFVTTF